MQFLKLKLRLGKDEILLGKEAKMLIATGIEAKGEILHGPTLG